MHSRGLLIVIEGVDRCGKTTQCQKLVDYLSGKGKAVRNQKFPDRSTEVGQLLDRYLRKELNFDDHCVHLLFSANRWEIASRIKVDIENGINYVTDRYAFSGVCYSAAKPMSMDWCKACDRGLPKPDAVFFLKPLGDSFDQVTKRSEFGRERYERVDFQQRVLKRFEEMVDANYWHVVDAGLPIEIAHSQITTVVDRLLLTPPTGSLEPLWSELG